MEERYLKINSCEDCPFHGRSSCAYNKTITNLCCYPINNNSVDRPREKVEKDYFLIASVTEAIHDTPIPNWCKLPKEVQ